MIKCQKSKNIFQITLYSTSADDMKTLPGPLIMKAQRAWGSGILIFLVSLSYRHPHPTNTWDEFMHENGSLFMRAPGCALTSSGSVKCED